MQAPIQRLSSYTNLIGASPSQGGCSMKRFRRLLSYTCAFALVLAVGAISIVYSQSPTQAPTGFNTPTLENGPGSKSTSNGMVLPSGDTFANDQAIFEEEDVVDGSLGPIYNARGCVDCHQTPVTGGSSQVTELRVGHRYRFGNFVNPTILINNGATAIANRSLVNDRAVCPQAQERVPGTETIRAQRASLNVLGD